ncbi:MAG: hypothetical protein KAI66_09105, partial [Lentisphaeria bacterium]|nr:hypothetical protein [Lentisphaeria bacterium]
FPLCGEGTDETMIGLTPVKLIHYEIWPGYVPIFGRVYHDYITSFGRTAPLAPQKIAGDPGPAMSIGWQLVLGNQIGRLWQISPKRLAEPVVATHLEYVRKACEVRDQFSQYLCLGEMQRPPRISGDVPELTTHEFRRLDGTVTLPSILAGTWRAPDGRVAVVVTNISRRNIAFTLQLDVAELGLAGAGASLVPRYPRAGQSIQERDKMFRHETSLDGLAVRLYEIVVPE